LVSETGCDGNSKVDYEDINILIPEQPVGEIDVFSE